MISRSYIEHDFECNLANFSITNHVGYVNCHCYYNIRPFKTVRYMTQDVLSEVAYTLILCQLDYCKVLYINATACELHSQMQINTVDEKVSDLTHILWLPIK